LFLDADDTALVRRYEGTRRRHPLAETEGPVMGVMRERMLMEQVKSVADLVIDSTEMNVHQLRDRVVSSFGTARPDEGMAITVVSFGFKHGLPTDSDTVFDLRFLPNPHWVEELRPFTGLDQAVKDYVLSNEQSTQFLDQLDSMLNLLLPAYAREGKAYLSIAVGCTGGQHRSVAMAEEIGRRLQGSPYPVMVRHRDLHKR
jgi:RNase adapter protein RapZ